MIFENEDYRNELRREIIRLINKEHNKSLYSTYDLIKLKQEENKNLHDLFLKIMNNDKSIKKIFLNLLEDELQIVLTFKNNFIKKRLMLSCDKKGNIKNEPCSFSLWDSKNVIWNKPDIYLDRYKEIIQELVDFGYTNLTTNEEINPSGTNYFKIYYKLLDYYIYLCSKNNEFKYTKRLNKRNYVEEEIQGYQEYYDEEIKLLKQNKRDELHCFLTNIQFNEKDISENLNKHLIKIR